ncbi:peroxiredoxin [Duganella caerulea]|uniref:Ohr family peroxiredoxin n=1 Tax=Duganella caerulea TaxID=2885762 RepID=UPI0030E9A239
MRELSAPPVSMLDKYVGEDFKPLYKTCVNVTGGCTEHGRASGKVRSDDGALDIELRLPKALGGPGGGTNPEQLFAAALAACFHGALTLLATKSDIKLEGCSVDASVAFGRDPVDGLYMLVAEVSIDMPGVPLAIAEELVRNAERVCPYTKMARHGIICIVALVKP